MISTDDLLNSLTGEMADIILLDYIKHVAFNLPLNPRVVGYVLALKETLNEIDNNDFDGDKNEPTLLH